MGERRIPMPHRPVRDPGRLRKIDREVNDAIARHSAAGFLFDAGGARSFARQSGAGADVVLLHGVPTSSSFLYRKVLPVLADQGLRGTAFDFPGLGLADRPEDFDYSWSGLARLDRARRSTRSASTAATSSSTTSAARSASSGRSATPDRVLSLTVAQHVRGRRQLPQAVADASVLDQGDRRGLASRVAPVALLGDLLLAGDRGPGAGPALRDLRPRARWCGCATAAARS